MSSVNKVALYAQNKWFFENKNIKMSMHTLKAAKRDILKQQLAVLSGGRNKAGNTAAGKSVPVSERGNAIKKRRRKESESTPLYLAHAVPGADKRHKRKAILGNTLHLVYHNVMTVIINRQGGERTRKAKLRSNNQKFS